MKLRTLSILFIAVIFTWSCKEEAVPDAPTETLEVSLQVNETYIYDTRKGGDEEGAVIDIQPNHYELSEIIRDETTDFSPVYYYKPSVDFVGSDEVLLKLVSLYYNDGVKEDISYVKIIFHINE